MTTTIRFGKKVWNESDQVWECVFPDYAKIGPAAAESPTLVLSVDEMYSFTRLQPITDVLSNIQLKRTTGTYLTLLHLVNADIQTISTPALASRNKARVARMKYWAQVALNTFGPGEAVVEISF